MILFTQVLLSTTMQENLKRQVSHAILKSTIPYTEILIFSPHSLINRPERRDTWKKSSRTQTIKPGSMQAMTHCIASSVQFSLSVVSDSVTPWIAACQAALSITNPHSLLKLMPIKLVMPSSHLILCHPLLLLPPIPPSITVFSNESTLRMRWPE